MLKIQTEPQLDPATGIAQVLADWLLKASQAHTVSPRGGEPERVVRIPEAEYRAVIGACHSRPEWTEVMQAGAREIDPAAPAKGRPRAEKKKPTIDIEAPHVEA